MLETVNSQWQPTSGWTTQLTIDGQLVVGDGPLLDVGNPATGENILTLNEASVEQIDTAVAAARKAFDSGVWADGEKRRIALEKLADLLEQNQEDFGGAMVEELGTPVNLLAPIQIGVPVATLRYFASKANLNRTRELGPDGNTAAESESIVRYVPSGVIAAIVAYNYPLLILALKLAPALAAGCTLVVSPSPQAPLAVLMFSRLIKEAGIPDGVVNFVVGGIEVGQTLTEHKDVDKVSFTGSVPVGRAVMQQAASTLKGIVLELGGRSATIVMPEVDFAPMVGPCHLRYLRHAGQGCASPARILVPETRLEEFIEFSKSSFKTLKVGDPWNPENIAGPLISEAHRERVEGYIERAVSAGARIVAGGGRPEGMPGWYMNPTLLAGLDNSFEIAQDEIFGPVGLVIAYRDIDHAIQIANDSTLGLAAAIYGPLEDAKQVAERLRVGTVYINGGGAIRMDAPMGGFKQSGIGREYGEEGLREYLEPQHVQWAL